MSKAKLELTVQQSESWPGLPTKRDIRRWILASLLEDANVTVRLIDEDEGRELNRYFRDRNKATNVLTFPYGETTPLSADIALCVQSSEEKQKNKTKRSMIILRIFVCTRHSTFKISVMRKMLKEKLWRAWKSTF